MKFIRFLMALFFSVALAACGSSSTPATYGISGTVTLSGAALAGATITLTGGTIATTDASGNYSFTGLANGSYTVTPTKAGNAFSPSSLAVSVSGANVTGTNFTATIAATTYSIPGAVSGATGVTLTLSGDNTGSVFAGSDGVYTLSGLLPGSYTVTPSLSGFTFSPTSRAVTIAAASSTANDFVATAIPVSHSLSGAVSGDTLSGVTITVTGAATASATTDSSGNYSVTGVYDGSYTMTPSKTGYRFTPSSLAVTVSGVAVAGKNFEAKANVEPIYSISGAVSGAVQSVVSVTLSGAGSATTTSNGSGNYTFAGLVNGSYTITPSMTGYTFSPVNAAATVSGANITGTNFVATAIPPTPYTQADLTGTWRTNMLRAGSTNGWLRATGTLDSSGLATVSSFLDSTGNSTPPAAGSMQQTISGSGVISETGVNAGSQVHMTMTSNKNFIAGTGSDGTSQLRIAQKVVPGTVYSNADIQNKTFVFHQLSVGSQYKWTYGAGTVDGTGQINISSQTDPSGTTLPGAQGTISVDSSGVVTMSPGMATFSGFLSDDKKTIVGTYTDDAGGGNIRYRLMVIQITGQTYTAGPLPAGTLFAHMLAVGNTAPAPFWLHFTTTVASGGVTTLSDWVSSISGMTGPGTTDTGSITSSGTVTIAGNASFHGQVSDDSKFMVATQTPDTGIYWLNVSTK
ncbi:MAG TPA: carboxypeptidase regulatory-like domain-containing protein [Rhodoferax sp.]